MAKSALPILAAVGAAAFLLMPKKKKKTSKNGTATGDANGTGDPSIVDAGTSGGWGWQVRQLPADPGFGSQYVGEVLAPTPGSEWIGVLGPQASQSDAQSVALQFISNQQ